MATYHELAPGDIKTARSFLNQLIEYYDWMKEMKKQEKNNKHMVYNVEYNNQINRNNDIIQDFV